MRSLVRHFICLKILKLNSKSVSIWRKNDENVAKSRSLKEFRSKNLKNLWSRQKFSNRNLHQKKMKEKNLFTCEKVKHVIGAIRIWAEGSHIWKSIKKKLRKKLRHQKNHYYKMTKNHFLELFFSEEDSKLTSSSFRFSERLY